MKSIAIKPAYESNKDHVRAGLRKSGGVIQPWMFNVLTPHDLKEIWKSGDWIEADES